MAEVYPTALNQQSYGFGVGGTIVDANEDGTSPGYVLGVSSTGHLWWWPYGGGDVYSSGTIPLAPHTTEVAVTYNGTQACMYLNAQLDSCTTIGAPGVPSFTKIGTKSWITGSWSGSVMNVQFYNTVLTTAEIANYLKG